MCAKRNLRDECYGSFIFSRDKPRLEKEINDMIRRHYYMMDYFECLSTRAKQLEMLVSKGGMYGIKESIGWLKKVCLLNGIDRVFCALLRQGTAEDGSEEEYIVFVGAGK